MLGCWLCTDQYTEATDSSMGKKKKRREGRGGERRETGEERRGEGMDEGRVNNEGEGHTSIRRERRFFARV